MARNLNSLSLLSFEEKLEIKKLGPVPPVIDTIHRERKFNSALYKKCKGLIIWLRMREADVIDLNLPLGASFIDLERMKDKPVSTLYANIGGISCRLPKSKNVEEFWDNLIKGRELLSPTRWPPGMLHIPPRMGLLPEYNRFDANFFDSLDEAPYMPATLYTLIEVIHECIVDSGIPFKHLTSMNTGVYLALSLDEQDAVTTSTSSNSKYMNTKSEFLGRIAYLFGFTGPSISVDSGNTSSFTAIQSATMDLCSGRSDYAIVAGANLILSPHHSYRYYKQDLLSPDGYCRPFDYDANGYVRSEGVVAFLLSTKSPLKRIYAEIYGVLCINDYREVDDIDYPDEDIQVSIISKVLAGEDVVYVEANADGIPTGDDDEIFAFVKSLCEERILPPLLVGTCKGNVGNTEACSGLVSILKCLLSIHHGLIPPTINYNVPSIDVSILGSNHPLHIVNEVTKLPIGNIGVNCFSPTGGVGHVLLKPPMLDHPAEDLTRKCPDSEGTVGNGINKQVKSESENFGAAVITLHAKGNTHANKFLDFVSKYHRKPEILSFLSSSFFNVPTKDSFPGYISLIDNTIKISMKKDKDIVPVCLVLHDGLFLNTEKINHNLFKIPIFQDILCTYEKIFKQFGKDLSFPNDTDLPFNLRLQTSIVLLMVYVDVLKQCHYRADFVCGYGLAEIVAAYYDGCIDQAVCLRIACLIGEYFDLIYNKGNDYDVTIELCLPTRSDFCLPDEFTIIAIINEHTVFARGPRQYVDQIKGEGRIVRLIHPNIPLYNLDDTQFDDLLQQLRATFQPSGRSSRWISSLDLLQPSTKESRMKNQLFDPEYIYRILITRVDIPKVMQYLPNIVKFHANSAQLQEYISPNDIFCFPTGKSLLEAIGELYLLSKSEYFGNFNKVVYPLDHTIPPISQLVCWDHSVEWPVPSWNELFIQKKSLVSQNHKVINCVNEHHDPVAVLLYQTIQVITAFEYPVFLQVNILPGVQLEQVQDAKLQLLWHTSFVSVHKNDKMLLFGQFRIENVYMDMDDVFGDESMVKYEILWKNDLMDFINTVFEYAISQFRSEPIAVLFDPVCHQMELRKNTLLYVDCEFETGICQSGGLMLQFSSPTISLHFENLEFSQDKDMLVKDILVYDLSKQTNATVMLYSGFCSITGKATIGISLILDECFYHRFIKTDRLCTQEELAKVVPILISHYLLHQVLELQPDMSLLIQPPYDAVFLFLIEMAIPLCQHIYASSWSLEHCNDLQEMFPDITSVWGINLTHKILSLTNGHGCEAVITLSGYDFNNACLTLANNGKLVLLGIPEVTETIGMSVFLRNISIQMTEPFCAIVEFLKRDNNVDSEIIGDILKTNYYQFCDGSSLEESSFYNQLHSNKFETPVRFSEILNYFESLEDDSEFFCKFTVKNLYILQSIKQTFSSFQKIFQSPVSESLRKTSPQLSPLSPSIVVTLPEGPSTTNSIFSPPTQSRKMYQMEIKQDISQLSSFVLKIGMGFNDVARICSPNYNLFPMKAEILFKDRSNLVPLNTVISAETPLIIVHSFSGNVHDLNTLGEKLMIPCIGLRMTNKTPKHSLVDMASYYISIIKASYPEGPYRLAGYSFGACVALEMAMQLQQQKIKVEALFLLEGSPDHISAHYEYVRRTIPKGLSVDKLKEAMDIDSLMKYIEDYQSKGIYKEIIKSLLENLPDIDSRLTWVNNYLCETLVSSLSPGKKHWIMAFRKLWMMQRPFLMVATEVLHTIRFHKGLNYLLNTRSAQQYIPHVDYEGKVDLLRIRSEPDESLPLAADYGLLKYCSDVKIHLCNGNHKTFLYDDEVAVIIKSLLPISKGLP